MKTGRVGQMILSKSGKLTEFFLFLAVKHFHIDSIYKMCLREAIQCSHPSVYSLPLLAAFLPGVKSLSLLFKGPQLGHFLAPAPHV